MASTVDSLSKDQLAVFLGEMIKPLSTAQIEITSVDGGMNPRHRMTITLDFNADQVYNPAGDNKLKVKTSYAVLDLGKKNFSAFEFSFQAENNGADDYTLQLIQKGDPPGSKGNHGA